MLTRGIGWILICASVRRLIKYVGFNKIGIIKIVLLSFGFVTILEVFLE